MMNRMMRPNISQFKQQEQSAPVQQTAYAPNPQTAPVSESVTYSPIPQVAPMCADTTSATSEMTDKKTGTVKTTLIRAENKVTVKIGESFYGFQYTEERAVEGEVDLDEARKSLVDTVNEVIDSQIAELMESMSN